MSFNRKQILKHWNQRSVESMYDKYLFKIEAALIKKYIRPGSKILDAGCGEGEGTLAYTHVKSVTIDAVDFSNTRLSMAQKRLKNYNNVNFKKIDFLSKYHLDANYDCIISQRFLINLLTWTQQKKVLTDFANLLKPQGKIILLEGSQQGVEELNQFRKFLKLKPIPIKWHNLFLNDKKLATYMKSNNFRLINHDGLGTYFFLTRGVRPFFDQKLNWDCQYNRIASSTKLNQLLNFGSRFSRLKLWVFQK